MDVTILVGACAGLAVALVIVVLRLKKQASEVQALSGKLHSLQQMEEEVRGLTEKLSAAQAFKDKAASLEAELVAAKKDAAEAGARVTELEADQVDKDELERLAGELETARQDAAAAKGRISELEADQGDKAEISRLTTELEAACRERDEKSAALLSLEEKFEEAVDDVVQSSIDKINHAEQAKEEAVKAAEDNYEMVVEAHAKIAEMDKLIKQLQGS